jgi:hypothetical protein
LPVAVTLAWCASMLRLGRRGSRERIPACQPADLSTPSKT